jgi:DNA polymerase-3 subunit gamma/tau
MQNDFFMDRFIVSARKYRPQTYDTVVGQQHITTTLKNAIRSNHLAHAFLFCGPRGVGKTTCARILAKAINCEKLGADGEACNTCHSCQSFNEGTSLNIHELDAASNNSVDDIRALVEQVRFAPQAGRYKVYIIDEVHMLSSSAFNAFLKTLEEPPPYAIFILATTEKHKILPTILSRCQIFDFKRITLQDTVDHLEAIAQKESIQTDEAALQLIAQKSEGCMRDALSILDKIVSFTNGAVTYNNTLEHLNILDADYYFRLMDCMLQQDLAGALLLFDDINKKGFEGDAVLNGFAEAIRNLLICKDERVASLLEVVETFKRRYVETARKAEAGYLISALNILSEAEVHYKTARNKRLHVEMVLIRLCYLQQALQLAATDGGVEKKNVVEAARSVAFKNITPVAAKGPAKQQGTGTKEATGAKLVIETAPQKPAAAVAEKPMSIPAPIAAPAKAAPTKAADTKKITSLEAIRQKVQQENCETIAADQPLQQESLAKAWQRFIESLKEGKNPAAQSFELAELLIKDANSFEATASNNINQKFIEFERNRACAFLQKELCNKSLKFSIVLVEPPPDDTPYERPLTSKEQYQKLIEAFPLVKELRDRLRLELDY